MAHVGAQIQISADVPELFIAFQLVGKRELP